MPIIGEVKLIYGENSSTENLNHIFEEIQETDDIRKIIASLLQIQDDARQMRDPEGKEEK